MNESSEHSMVNIKRREEHHKEGVSNGFTVVTNHLYYESDKFSIFRI